MGLGPALRSRRLRTIVRQRVRLVGRWRHRDDRLACRLFAEARAGHLAGRVGADTVNSSPCQFWATLDADSLRPYLPNVPVLLSVASFQRHDYQLRRPPRLPRSDMAVAVDTGAFAWFRSLTSYHFSAAQYANWIAGVQPPASWAVIPDRPTEDMPDTTAVRNAQLQTTDAI